jgi:predicted nuclease with TOPRIM domain
MGTLLGRSIVTSNLIERVDEIDHEIQNLNVRIENAEGEKQRLTWEKKEIMEAVKILSERLEAKNEN